MLKIKRHRISRNRNIYYLPQEHLVSAMMRQEAREVDSEVRGAMIDSLIIVLSFVTTIVFLWKLI